MSGTRQSWDETRLAGTLVALGREIAWPEAADRTPDLATRVRVGIVERAALTSAPSGDRGATWRARRPSLAIVLALLALLALAAVAAGVGLGLPGLRLVLGDPSTPPATASAPTSASGAPGATAAFPGSDLGLGSQVTLEEARAMTGRPLPVPGDPALGPPDAVYVDPIRADQVAMVWAPAAGLPATLEPDVGLILTSFDGTTETGFFEKLLSGGSTLERLIVAGQPAFWISGDPHLYFYRTADGQTIDDPRRWVGDALLWSDGTTTYRLETALGRDATIALAEDLMAGPDGS